VPRRKRDIFAEFYDALEEMGEYCAFDIGRYCTGMPAPEWTHFRHQDYDGATALAHLLLARANNESDFKNNLAALSDMASSPNPPSSRQLFVAWLRLIRDRLRQRVPMRWKRFDKSWRPVSASLSRPTAVAWSLFSKDETRRLGELARSHGVSLQSWLLWALKEAIVPELVPGTGVLTWHVPVSMHGAFPGEMRNSNFSLEVRFPPEAPPKEVHKAIRKELRLRTHWIAAKLTLSFAWMIPRWIFRRLVRFAAMLPPWQGSFSNSGAFALSPETADTPGTAEVEEWFIGLNPVIKSSPLGVCCSEWRGRLALSVQIHPALATDPHVARDWIASWRRFADGGEQRDGATSQGAAPNEHLQHRAAGP
jgi:hypothetical protein